MGEQRDDAPYLHVFKSDNSPISGSFFCRSDCYTYWDGSKSCSPRMSETIDMKIMPRFFLDTQSFLHI